MSVFFDYKPPPAGQKSGLPRDINRQLKPSLGENEDVKVELQNSKQCARDKLLLIYHLKSLQGLSKQIILKLEHINYFLLK